MSNDVIKKVVPTLYEDPYLLAVAKPAGIDASTAPGLATPGLAELLAACRGDGETFDVAKRLTREESGVLLLSKDAAMTQHLRVGLRSRRITQQYTAVVAGRMSKARLVIDSSHGASHGRTPKTTDRRGRRPVSNKTPVRGGDEGQSTVVKRVKTGKRRVLIECQTVAPTTHALRAQLRAAGLRLLGDKVHARPTRGSTPEQLHLHLSRITFHHPKLGKKITIRCPSTPGPALAVEGERDVDRPLRAALARRLSAIAGRDTNAYRLLSGNVEGLSGLVAERYADVVVLQAYESATKLAESLPSVARWYRKTLGVQTTYAKWYDKKRSQGESGTDSERCLAEPLLGRRAAPEIAVLEYGVRFAVRPYDGFSVGLFPDQRENRQRIRSLARGKDVLNLFAYTCSFSVVAAVGGAKSVVSVDISPKHLEWGRSNFVRNGLDPAAHQFILSDSLDYLKRATRQGKRFDIILIDPPSFAHGRKAKQRFSIMTDLTRVIAGAAGILNPGGRIMVSTNHRRLSLPDLKQRLRDGAGGRTYEMAQAPRLPADFAMDPAHAKTIFARFD